MAELIHGWNVLEWMDRETMAKKAKVNGQRTTEMIDHGRQRSQAKESKKLGAE